MNGSTTIRFALEFRLRNLPVSGRPSVPVGRPFVELALPGATANVPDCFIDTGAAVSVISWPLRNLLPWRPAPTTIGELTVWNGYPCDFGETTIRLYDRVHRRISASLPLVGKFLRTPVPFHKDRFVILGLNFLMDNAVRLEIAGQPWNLGGH